MKFTVDFILGFAMPHSKVVKLSPGGLKTWWAHVMARKMIAQDGVVRIVAVRLLGVTIGCTFARECVTQLTSSSPSPAQAPPSQPQPQLSPEQVAKIRAIMSQSIPQSAPTPTTPSSGQ